MGKWVLWGNHLNEYRDMFDLSEENLNMSLLEYGCGLSAFNAEMHAIQHELSKPIVSFDPLFALDKTLLSLKATSMMEDLIQELQKKQDQFDFSQYGHFETFITARRDGVAEFLADYETGHAEKRYLPLTDKTLPCHDFQFEFALSSHYLFLGNEDLAFHLDVIRELARVAKEVRIFPLIDGTGQPSALLGPVLLGLQQAGYGAEVRKVDYHLYPKGNAMLRVWAQQCSLS